MLDKNNAQGTKEFPDWIPRNIEYTVEETSILLSGRKFEELPDELSEK